METTETALTFEYPEPRRDESVVEDLHGHKIADPYRWMEDPDSDETKAFVEAQNKVSRPFIDACESKEAIKQKLTELWNYPKYSVPRREGKRFFFSKNSGLQNQSVMYVQDSLQDEPRVFFDPNSLSDDGTVSLVTYAFSDDGEIFAYGLSKSGSDWFEVRFKNVGTGEDYPEVLTKVKFTGLSWTLDNKGLFYGCYPEHSTEASGRDTASHGNQKLLYHRIGTPQTDDVLCVEFPEHPKWRIDADVTDCGRYLLISPKQDCRDNLVFFCDLQALKDGEILGTLPLTQIIFKLEYDYEYVTNTGSKVIFRTNKNAPNYRLIVIDLEHPEEENWETLLAEDEKDVLEWATCVHEDKLIVCYMQDVKNVLQVRQLSNGEVICTLPLDIGSVVGFSGKKKHNELFYKFSSMITPGVIYHIDMTETPLKPKVFLQTEIKDFDQSQYKVEQVFYPSKDGTKIPMFIASSKDEPRDGSSPCLLYGYGGFNISLTPSFSVTQLFFIKHFGYMAIPNIRGGGEYGEKWHNAGRLFNKQNCFDDFCAAAEYLVKNKYTSISKLAIEGGSNGGLLVGACVNQRPELFGAAIAAVGVFDMVRFHKFTIGYAWCSDFGNPDEKEHFENNLKYSPLHNIRIPEGDVQYPSLLLTTADHDDRVVPSHSLKFIAELHHVLGKVEKQKSPLMIRLETKAGHGRGKPTSKAIEEITDGFCFLVRTLGYKLK